MSDELVLVERRALDTLWEHARRALALAPREGDAVGALGGAEPVAPCCDYQDGPGPVVYHQPGCTRALA